MDEDKGVVLPAEEENEQPGEPGEIVVLPGAEQPEEQPAKKRKNKIWLIILAAALVLIAAAVIVLAVLRPKTEKTDFKCLGGHHRDFKKRMSLFAYCFMNVKCSKSTS